MEPIQMLAMYRVGEELRELLTVLQYLKEPEYVDSVNEAVSNLQDAYLSDAGFSPLAYYIEIEKASNICRDEFTRLSFRRIAKHAQQLEMRAYRLLSGDYLASDVEGFV